MLVTDNFVFLNLPHTGSAFIYDVITRCFPSAREIDYCFSRGPLPTEYSHFPIVGTIRNPWEFYASWYHHQRSDKNHSRSHNALFRCLSDNGKLDFVQTIQNALDLGVNDYKLNHLIQALPEGSSCEAPQAPTSTKNFIRRIRGTGSGLYTFQFNQLFSNAENVFFCRFESLPSDLVAFFERIGVASDALRRYVLGMAVRYGLEHHHYSTDYTPELAGLVSLRDRRLIDRFGFTFETLHSAHRRDTQLYSASQHVALTPVSLVDRRGTFETRPKKPHLTSFLIKKPVATQTEVSEKTLMVDDFARRIQFQSPQVQDPHFLKKVASQSQILIIEGISGSGKDTLQGYLRTLLKHRNVYDYAEGELLQSWNQLQIGGIFELRVKFMKLFVRYITDVVTRDENAVFLLNRFHLSTYVSTIIRQPTLEKDYDDILNMLRALSVHIFILQLKEDDIEKRGAHPERSTGWQKYQKQIAEKEGFQNILGRRVWQQRLILQAADRQQIPYSVMTLAITPNVGGGRIEFPEPQGTVHYDARTSYVDARIDRQKRSVTQTILEG